MPSLSLSHHAYVCSLVKNALFLGLRRFLPAPSVDSRDRALPLVHRRDAHVVFRFLVAQVAVNQVDRLLLAEPLCALFGFHALVHQPPAQLIERIGLQRLFRESTRERACAALSTRLVHGFCAHGVRESFLVSSFVVRALESLA